jgi:hypothetical protein
MHHVAFEVEDVAAELVRLAAAGAELVDEHPRRGLFGHESRSSIRRDRWSSRRVGGPWRP